VRRIRAALAALFVLAASPAWAGELDTDPAVLAARSWLATIDAGQYQMGWEDAADSLHVGTTRERWEAALRKSRDAKGAVASRKVVHAKYSKSSYSDPGSFVEIQFETRFEKRGFTESVSAIRTFDGSWKVSSYRIR
jgi:opacity protein-like surface antigen